MSRPAFSVVCVYNDRTALESWLEKSLNGQSCPHERIMLDNTSGRFASAAEALNYGGSRASGEYLLFAHQDVLLVGGDWLEKALPMLKGLPRLGVAGAAGMLRLPRLVPAQVGAVPVAGRVGLAESGDPAGDVFGSAPIEAPADVQTLDEQLLIVPSAVFSALKFDAVSCPGWHLYGAEYSLSAGRMGLRAAVLPLRVKHRSTGITDGAYFSALRRVLRKHRGVGSVFTTCGSWYDRMPLNYASLAIMALWLQAGRLLGRNSTGWDLSLKRLKLLAGSGRAG